VAKERGEVALNSKGSHNGGRYDSEKKVDHNHSVCSKAIRRRKRKGVILVGVQPKQGTNEKKMRHGPSKNIKASSVGGGKRMGTWMKGE